MRGPRWTEVWMKASGQRLRGLGREGRVHSESVSKEEGEGKERWVCLYVLERGRVRLALK